MVLIESPEALASSLSTARQPVWVLSTFLGEMAASAPELHHWLESDATHQSAFPGVIADGTVHVHVWRPPSAADPPQK